MGYKLKSDGLKFPKGERTLQICINKNDEVQFIITSVNGIVGRFRLYELVDDIFVLLRRARTIKELVEKLYYRERVYAG